MGPALPLKDRAADPRAYHRLKLRVFLAGTALDFGALAVFQFGGPAAALKDLAENLSAHRPVQIAIYMAVFFTTLHLLSLPLGLYSGFRIEKRFALSTQSLRSWGIDRIKRYALGLVFFTGTMGSLLLLIDAFPETWWLWAGAGWFLLTFGLARVFPTWILPLFYPTRPLERTALSERLLGLCRRLDINVRGGVHVIALSAKTRKANAALVGVGRSRRILLGDTLLGNFTEDEVEMVVAHELGHHARHHIRRGLLLNATAALAGFWILYRLSGPLTAAFGANGFSDLGIFPAMAFLSGLGGLAALPLQNAYSRRLENEADDFALETLPSEPVFRSLMQKLGTLNLAHPDPHPAIEFLFYDHPSIKNRLLRAAAGYSGRTP